jgi:hypothetical protein
LQERIVERDMRDKSGTRSRAFIWKKGKYPTPFEILEAINGLVYLDKLCIPSNGLKDDLKVFLKASRVYFAEHKVAQALTSTPTRHFVASKNPPPLYMGGTCDVGSVIDPAQMAFFVIQRPYSGSHITKESVVSTPSTSKKRIFSYRELSDSEEDLSEDEVAPTPASGVTETLVDSPWFVFVQTQFQAYTTADYYGWDPKTESPPGGLTSPAEYVQPGLCPECQMPNARGALTCAYCRVLWVDSAGAGHVRGCNLSMLSPLKMLTSALTNSYYCSKLGPEFTLGMCEYIDFFRQVSHFFPYKSVDEISWDGFQDQTYLVTHVLLTLSDWGEQSLPRDLFPREIDYLLTVADIFLKEENPHIIGEIVECLHILGFEDNNPEIQRMISALIDWQNPGGEEKGAYHWREQVLRRNGKPKRDPVTKEHLYVPTNMDTKFHATMTAIQGLLVRIPDTHVRPVGPALLETVPLLKEWSKLYLESSAQVAIWRAYKGNGGTKGSMSTPSSPTRGGTSSISPSSSNSPSPSKRPVPTTLTEKLREKNRKFRC